MPPIFPFLKESLDKKQKSLVENSKLFDKTNEEILTLNNKLEINKRDKSLAQNSLVNIKNNLADISSNQSIQEKLYKSLDKDLESSEESLVSLNKSISLYKNEVQNLSQSIEVLKESLGKKEGENIKLIEENKKLDENLKNQPK